MIGETLGGRYQVVSLLGQGSMGTVYEARHTGTGRRVAVKVLAAALLQHPDALTRFQREAQAAGAIESLHIAQVLDVSVDPALGVPFLVMEHLVGEDLERIEERLAVLPPELVVRIGAQACLGLARAHAAGIVHRDIKPANLFLTERDGGELVVKLLDFGIAKLQPAEAPGAEGHRVTRSGTLVGSPLYMSPEQAQGEVTIDARSDLWSLGVTLYQALSGRAPHEDIEAVGKLIIAICTTRAPPLRDVAPTVPAALAAIVDRALCLDPAQRFQSADEMLEALRRLAPGGIAIQASMLVAAPRPDGTGPTAGPRRAPGRGGIDASTAAISSERRAAPVASAATRWIAYGAGAALVAGLGVIGYVATRGAGVTAPAATAAPEPSAGLPAPSITPPPSQAPAPPITTTASATAAPSGLAPVSSPAKAPPPRAPASSPRKAPLSRDPTTQM